MLKQSGALTGSRHGIWIGGGPLHGDANLFVVLVCLATFPENENVSCPRNNRNNPHRSHSYFAWTRPGHVTCGVAWRECDLVLVHRGVGWLDVPRLRGDATLSVDCGCHNAVVLCGDVARNVERSEHVVVLVCVLDRHAGAHDGATLLDLVLAFPAVVHQEMRWDAK